LENLPIGWREVRDSLINKMNGAHNTYPTRAKTGFSATCAGRYVKYDPIILLNQQAVRGERLQS